MKFSLQKNYSLKFNPKENSLQRKKLHVKIHLHKYNFSEFEVIK